VFPGTENGEPGSAEARGAFFTKNTTSCRFFFANAVCWCCASHPAKQPRTVAGIGGSSRSFLHEKHDILSFFLGKRSLLVLRFASCEAAPNRSRDRRKLEELLDFSPLLGKARPPRGMAKKPLRRDFCRPGGAQPKTQTLVAARSSGADPVSFC
jgi:hypothetical protein